jgi:shikimate kinase
MRITKNQLRRIIKEEKEKLAEVGLKNPGDYAIGAYFDVNMMKQFNQLMYDMFENAMEAATEDMGDPQDAYAEVMAAFETLIEEAQSDMRY